MCNARCPHSAAKLVLTSKMSSPSIQGTVKWFNVGIGYGFIRTETHGEVFVHAKSCPGGFLMADDTVLFRPALSADSSKSIQAVDVVRCEKPILKCMECLGIRAATFVC